MSFFNKLFNKDKEESPALTKEQKQIEKKLKNLNHLKYGDKKELSAVEIENSYFGNGILVKDTSSKDAYYIDKLCGFGNHSFGDKPDASYGLYEITVREDNIDYVFNSMESIYKKSDQIMEECYDEIYKEITTFFEDNSDSDWNIRLKSEFSLEYLKANWYVIGLSINDDCIEISIGIKAAENPEHDEFYNVSIFVDYNTQEPEVSFDVVW
ncbi:MAG: hypothetical protein IJ619_05570 [Eubacterium sp.]|nr:hypothetical protein [Eubacterium sp.]